MPEIEKRAIGRIFDIYQKAIYYSSKEKSRRTGEQILRTAVIKKVVVKHPSPPEPHPGKKGIVTAEQRDIGKMCSADGRRNGEQSQLHHQYIAIMRDLRPPTKHAANGVAIPERTLHSAKRVIPVQMSLMRRMFTVP